MALGNVYMTDTDGNIGTVKYSYPEKVSGLLFDISGQQGFWTKGKGLALKGAFQDTVVEFDNFDEVVAAGITPYTGKVDSAGDSEDFLHGVPYYHIKNYFRVNGGTGKLFVAFADCSQDWSAVYRMQQEADGQISQFGVWTERSLWKEGVGDAPYSVNIVDDLQLVGESLANEYFAPAVILLNADTAKVKTESGVSDKVVLSKIPSVIGRGRYVSVLLGQAVGDDVQKMQLALDSATPVGTLGIALGLLATGNVAENIGWVGGNDIKLYCPAAEFGFGDVTKTSDGQFTSVTPYSSLTRKQLDTLDDLGYVFLVKYPGLEGSVFYSDDKTCSDGDFRSLSRNRAINKSRRGVRAALLPFVNSALKIDPATGQLSAAQLTLFKNAVQDVLDQMVKAEEISGVAAVTIPADQNILKDDTLRIEYKLVPMGSAKFIKVSEGFVVSQNK